MMMYKDPVRATIPPDRRTGAEQPKWRRDFPIDWPEDEYVSRRDLVKFIVLTSLAFTTGQFWLLGKELLPSKPREWQAMPIANINDLAVGESLIFHYPEGDHTPRL